MPTRTYTVAYLNVTRNNTVQIMHIFVLDYWYLVRAQWIKKQYLLALVVLDRQCAAAGQMSPTQWQLTQLYTPCFHLTLSTTLICPLMPNTHRRVESRRRCVHARRLSWPSLQFCSLCDWCRKLETGSRLTTSAFTLPTRRNLTSL